MVLCALALTDLIIVFYFRCWVQAVFRLNEANKSPLIKPGDMSGDPASDLEISISEGVAAQMFGISISDDEVMYSYLVAFYLFHYSVPSVSG